jgi:hypothetical protein
MSFFRFQVLYEVTGIKLVIFGSIVDKVFNLAIHSFKNIGHQTESKLRQALWREGTVLRRTGTIFI